jgi:hypothetical protein
MVEASQLSVLSGDSWDVLIFPLFHNELAAMLSGKKWGLRTIF